MSGPGEGVVLLPSGLTRLVRVVSQRRVIPGEGAEFCHKYERPAARLVLQGAISKAKAEDVLALLLMGTHAAGQRAESIDAGLWLCRARERLARDIADEQAQRGSLAFPDDLPEVGAALRAELRWFRRRPLLGQSA